jgi:hypothetical protein
MHSIVGRFIQWAAEFLDRSLYTVPDVDESLSRGHQSCTLPNHFTHH